MLKNIMKRIPDCTCCGLLNSTFSIKLATWVVIFIYLGGFIFDYLVTSKISYNTPLIFVSLIFLLCFIIGLKNKQKQQLNIFFIYGVFLLCQIVIIIVNCVASVMLIANANDKDNVNSFREKLRNSKFNINDSKYSDNDIVSYLKIFSIAEIVCSVIFICFTIPYYFAALHYAYQLIQAIEEEEGLRELEMKEMTSEKNEKN
jgi:uncharacterized integral membrane protein